MMFGQGGPAKVFVATRPVDFRKGIGARKAFDRRPRAGAGHDAGTPHLILRLEKRPFQGSP